MSILLSAITLWQGGLMPDGDELRWMLHFVNTDQKVYLLEISWQDAKGRARQENIWVPSASGSQRGSRLFFLDNCTGDGDLNREVSWTVISQD